MNSVHYKMGNTASKSPVKVTNPLDPRAAFDFIANFVDHAFNDHSTPSSSVKTCASNCDQDKNNSHQSNSSATILISATSEVDESVSSKKPSDSSEVKAKKPEIEEKKFDLEGENEDNCSIQKEKENNVPIKVTADSYLHRWVDYQQPSTSKPKVIQFVNHNQGENYLKDDQDDFSDIDSDDYDDPVDYDGKCISLVHQNLLQDIFAMPKPRDNFIPVNQLIAADDDDEDRKSIGNLSKLLAGLAHNGSSYGPRCKRNISNDSDSDDSDSVKDNPPSNLIVCTPKEDNDQLGIPRTQRINKAGDPVGEKCTCHHHQVVATK